ncbi:MAG TPA: hypothetical protein DF613_11890 [Lachnospiraceae bacterium]|nr:hypothetical protein [Lachnospiraceae bacterium]
MKIKCGLYDRVSTELQAQFGLSVTTQKEDLYRYAREHGYEVAGFFADEGITARKKLQNRKGFLQLMELVKQDRIDLILVTKLDRWFRNVRDYHNTQAILEAHHCNWKTIYEDYDTSTADGQLKINIMLAVAQNECDRTSERIKVVFDHKFRCGEHITGAAPYGYVTVDKKLQKDPETRSIVEDIFRSYFTCFSKRQTVYHILDTYENHPKRPTSHQILRVLSSEQYAGIYRGRRDYFPAYISPEQLQTLRHTSDTRTYPRTGEPYIFSGLIRCPVCGAVLTGFRKKQSLKDGSVSIYKRYRCSRKYASHPGPCLSETVVESFMLQHLDVPPFMIRAVFQGRRDVRSDKTPTLRGEMHRLNIMYQKNRITEEYYESQYRHLERELKKEETAAAKKTDTCAAPAGQEFFGDWRELYLLLDSRHKNAFWKRMIREITIDKDTHKLKSFS